MTAPRLPRNLRRRAATERVVGWSWPPAPVADPEDDGPENIAPADRCHNCGGWGTWTETREGSDGRDVDVDYPCDHCSETGIEP